MRTTSILFTLMLTSMVSLDIPAQIGHPTIVIDGGHGIELQIFVYEADEQLKAEGEEAHAARRTSIETWKNDGTIRMVVYRDDRSDIHAGPRFHALAMNYRLEVAKTVAKYARRGTPRSRVVFIYSYTDKLMYSYSLEGGELLRHGAAMR